MAGVQKALIVGVGDAVGPRQQGWRCPVLHGVNRDCPNMKSFLQAKNFTVEVLHPNAHASEVVNRIDAAAQSMTKGDFFVFYDSSHGGQLADRSGDEEKDECLLLFDRVLVDDELGELWPRFKSGVRILTLFDCCHSQTMLRKAQPPEIQQPKLRAAQAPRKRIPGFGISSGSRSRSATRSVGELDIKASLINLSACKDEELAQEENSGGLFTNALIRLANSAGTYNELIEQLADSVERESRAADPANIQNCQMSKFGPHAEVFAQMRPFSMTV